MDKFISFAIRDNHHGHQDKSKPSHVFQTVPFSNPVEVKPDSLDTESLSQITQFTCSAKCLNIVKVICLEYFSQSSVNNIKCINDLCRVSGASRRTLHRMFKKTLGITPMQFLKLLRMNHARRLLSAYPNLNTSVKHAALNAGFADMGRFAVEYRRMFGECPSATLSNRRNSNELTILIETDKTIDPLLTSPPLVIVQKLSPSQLA